MTATLAERKCIPCEGGVPPLAENEAAALLQQLGGEWHIVDSHHLEKSFRFKNFRRALDFTNSVGMIAEREGHHPDIHLSWGKVTLIIWTHVAGGLTENDFVLAAKADNAYQAWAE
jgi:4a-hydroxytetrahydrobiopterin dehydratase